MGSYITSLLSALWASLNPLSDTQEKIYFILGILALLFIPSFLFGNRSSGVLKRVKEFWLKSPYRWVIVTIMIFLWVSTVQYGMYTQISEENADLQIQIENTASTFALPDELLTSHLNGMQIRLTDLTRENTYIRNKVFTDCDLYGPCVVHFVDSTVANIHLEKGSIDAILISSTNEALQGVIGFENCILENCRFRHIGIIGKPEIIEEMKSEVIYED